MEAQSEADHAVVFDEHLPQCPVERPHKLLGILYLACVDVLQHLQDQVLAFDFAECELALLFLHDV
jgi:hypothetical protein